jgi:FkbM family methyltransferase
MIGEFRFPVGDHFVNFKMSADSANPGERALHWYFQSNQVPEPEVVHLMLRAVHAGDVVVDGGANLGFFTLLLSRLVGDTGKVYAFEPGANNLPSLRKNLALNECKNVTVIEQPLWSHEARMHLSQPEDGGYDSLSFEPAGVELGLDCTYLDRAVPVGDRVRLIKLDIEGAEPQALLGATGLLRKDHPIVVLETNPVALPRLGGSIENLQAFMAARAYLPHVLSDAGGLPARVPPGCRIKPIRQNANLLFCDSNDLADCWPEVEI